jgi:hypothetical protein
MNNWKAFTLLFTISIIYACSVAKDPTPDAHPDAKVYTAVINTTNMGNSAEANIVDSVKAGSEVIKLRLEVTGPTSAEYLYVMYSTDNSAFQPLAVATIRNAYGTFAAGNTSSYSLKVPNLTNFTIDIAVGVRNKTTALNDVYKIWVTDSLGSFAMPAYHRTLGIATVNLMYKQASLPDTYTVGTANMSSQSSKNYGSWLSTAAQVATMDSIGYKISPQSSDIRLVTLTEGKKDNNSSSLWLYSPADVLLANPAVSGQTDFVLPTSGNSRTTLFDTYSGTTLFDSVKTADLLALPTPANKSIEVIKDGVYIFQTQDQKKGLIKINSTSVSTSIVGIGSTTCQNVNVSVKVLN